MKGALVLAVLGLAVAIVQAELCVNHDIKDCSVTCSNGDRVTCEHNVCTCGPPCTAKDDCAACAHDGHMAMDAHCVDGACTCEPPMPPNGGHPPGGH